MTSRRGAESSATVATQSSTASIASTETTEAPASRRVPAPELAVVGGVALALGALIVVLAAVHGALGAARNDDWSFYRVAFAFDATHHFRVDGWPQMTLVGHTLLAWPIVALFGKSIIALQLLGLTAVMVGVICSYVLVRRFLSPGWAAIACLSLAVGPVLGTVAISYMTDTTALAAQLATLVFGVRACESRAPARSGWLLAAAATGLLAFSIREFGVVALAAVFVVAFLGWGSRPDERKRLLGVAVLVAAVALAFYAWRRSVPHSVSLSLDTSPGFGAVRQLARSALTLGLLVSPAVFAISPMRAARAAWQGHRALAIVALGGSALCVLVARATLLGNYVTVRGSYPATSILRGDYNAIPDPFYGLVRLVAIYALVVSSLVTARAIAELLACARQGRGRSAVAATARNAPAVTMCIVFTLGLAVTYVGVIVATTTTFFDRYLIPLVPLVAGLLVLGGLRYSLCWRAPLRTAAAALAVYAALGFVFIDAAATVDGAKWRAGQRLTDANTAAATVDAGLEWFGFHQPDNVKPGWEHRSGPLTTRPFSPRPVCATVVLHGTKQAANRTAGRSSVLHRSDVQTLLGRDIVVLGVEGPDRCPQSVTRQP